MTKHCSPHAWLLIAELCGSRWHTRLAWSFLVGERHVLDERSAWPDRFEHRLVITLGTMLREEVHAFSVSQGV